VKSADAASAPVGVETDWGSAEGDIDRCFGSDAGCLNGTAIVLAVRVPLSVSADADADLVWVMFIATQVVRPAAVFAQYFAAWFSHKF
jgi:hypothetical protein